MKMQTKTGNRFRPALVGVTLLLFSAALPVQAAWNVPTCNPDTVGPTDPTCNVAAPLNVSTGGQSKAGSLTIQNTLSAADLQVSTAFGGNGSIEIISSAGVALSVAQNNATGRGVYIAINNVSPAQEIDQSGTGPGLDVNSTSGVGITAIGGIEGINATGGTYGGVFQSSGTAAVVAQNTGGSNAVHAVGSADPNSFALPGTLSGYGRDGVRAGSDQGYAVVGVTNGSATSSAVLGYSSSGYGVFGYSQSRDGVYGNTQSTTTAYGGYFCNQYTRCAGLGGPVYAGYFNNRVFIQANGGSAALTVQNSSTSTSARAVLGHTGTTSLVPLTPAQAVGVSGQAYQGYGVLAYGQNSTGLFAQGNIGAELSGSVKGTTIKSAGGGTGAEITTDQGGTALKVKTSNSSTVAGLGIDVDVDAFETALETHEGFIHNEGGYNGGVVYPNENAGGGLYPNLQTRESHLITLPPLSGAESNQPLAIEFDGSDIWVLSQTTVANSMGSLHRIDVATNRIVEGYNITTLEGPGKPSDLLNVESDVWDDVMFVFGENGEYQPIRLYADKSSIPATASTGATGTIYGSVEDGNSIWLSTSTGVYDWDFEGSTGSAAVVTGILSYDVIFADGFIWASDYGNAVVNKIDPNSRVVVATIPVQTQPRGLAYDGQYVWVANSQSNSISRIHTLTHETQHFDVTALGTAPKYLVFDGAKIWITFANTRVGSFDVAERKTDQVVTVGTNPMDIAFDGTNVWTANSSSGDTSKIPTGTGFGVNPGAYQLGLLIAGQDDNLYCLYIDSAGALRQSTTLSNCNY